MSMCKECKSFRPLIAGGQYGTCEWFKLNPMPALPFFATVTAEYSTIDGNCGADCPAYKTRVLEAAIEPLNSGDLLAAMHRGGAGA